MDDEKIYNAILDELRESGPRQGLWAKCFTEANGNENAAKALYFKYRAQQLANQEKPATPNASSTDLSKNITSATKTVSYRKPNIVVPLLSGLLLLFLVAGWLYQNDQKSKEDAKQAEIVAAELASANALAKVEKLKEEQKSSAPESTKTLEATDTLLDVSKKNELIGKALEKDLAKNLHLFKYRIKTADNFLYSKDEINFYPKDYKYSIYVQDDTSIQAVDKLIGTQSKNQPNVIIYTTVGNSGNVPPTNYCYRKQDDQDIQIIKCFYSLDGRQEPKIKFNNKFVELSFMGYRKNDSYAGGTIPVSMKYEYINGEIICTSGQCDFKNFEK